MKIMLACAGGMSSSILVNKMKEAAKTKEIEVEVWAISESKIEDNITKCDVLLLGPQIRYVLERAKRIAKPYNIPVEIIEMRSYGMCDGEKVLEQALNMKR